MSSFRFTKELHSYEVNVALIKQIEEYLISKCAEILGVTHADIEKNYQIKLTDSFGTETFPKISSYKHPIFPNDISEIQINLQYPNPKYFNFLIAFNESWKSCRVAIELESEKPREDIVTIWNGIEKILSFNKTNYELFYGKHKLSTFGFIAGITLLIAAIAYSDISNRKATLCLSGFIFIIIWYTIGTSFHPYTSFDTQKNKSKKAWSKWFQTGLAGLIIFDIILIAFFRKWFP